MNLVVCVGFFMTASRRNEAILHADNKWPNVLSDHVP
jgi:hypothetical protein